jgi:hypothetical protein
MAEVTVTKRHENPCKITASSEGEQKHCSDLDLAALPAVNEADY